MTESIPNCDPQGVYCVKRTYTALGVCKKTLQKLRRAGLIKPINNNPSRYKYSGQSIIDCWTKASKI